VKNHRAIIIPLLVAVAVLLVAGVTVLVVRSNDRGTPDDASADAGFARDMAHHHAQAVEMAEIIRDRTDDARMDVLATDIVLTQQAQIGQMGGWLDVWGLKRASIGRPAMAWAGANHQMMGAMMPGLATDADVAALGTLPIDEAEVRFLQLMIVHHRGGAEMAQAVLDLDPSEVVDRLAASIVRSQTAEITAMSDMLDG